MDYRKEFERMMQSQTAIALATYGYLKDPQDKTKLIVDPETVDTVRNIFRWYIDGQGKTPLAKKLNALGIPSPLKQRFMRDGRERPNHEYASKMSWLWSAQTITTILENPTYLGISRKINDHRSATKSTAATKRTALTSVLYR